jgi:3-oxoacyl-[acyl-carrier-protein] synthase II
MLESEDFYARLCGVVPGRAPLSWIPSQQYNGPGDAVARELGTSGPVTTLSSACTSGALSIADALDALRSGEIDLAVAGGSDSLCQLTYAGFNSLRAVDLAPSRPFRTDRAGLTLGEGAGVVILETLKSAQERGATPLAELLAGASTCDAHHMTAPSPNGVGAAAAIRRALSEAQLDPEAVDFVSAHGTGTHLNDAAEWQALATVFGARAAVLPVTSVKGSIGHLLGAAGAVEAVATVRCLLEGVIHPTPGGGSVDPEAPVHLVRRPESPRRLQVGLSLNLAFGGSNAALLFRRWSPT